MKTRLYYLYKKNENQSDFVEPFKRYEKIDIKFFFAKSNKKLSIFFMQLHMSQLLAIPSNDCKTK